MERNLEDRKRTGDPGRLIVGLLRSIIVQTMTKASKLALAFSKRLNLKGVPKYLKGNDVLLAEVT